MDHSSSAVATAATSRTSSIPRPSRLPVFRTSSNLDTRPASPTLSSTFDQSSSRPSIGRQSLHGTIRARPSFIPPPTPRATDPSFERTPVPRTQHSRLPSTTSKLQQPVSHLRGASISALSFQSSPPDPPDVRRLSDQENEAQLEAQLDQIDELADINTASLASPSLNDRTLESLSHIPTPTSNRRRSSFFNPHTPMPTQSRPSSVMGSCSISKLNYATARRPTIVPRPNSPLKPPPAMSKAASVIRPATGKSDNLASRRNSIIPARPPLATSQMRHGANQTSPPGSVTAATRRVSYGPVNTLERSQRPRSSIATISQKPDVHRSLSTMARRQPMNESHPAIKATRTVSAQTAKPTISRLSSPPVAAKPTSRPASSTALRAQIAEARTAQRKANIKPSVNTRPDIRTHNKAADITQLGVSSDFDGLIAERLEIARRSGRLNISAMSLKRIPGGVLQMYTTKSMEESSIPWFEAVHLSKLIAADNELEIIEEEAFPDHDIVPAEGNAVGHVFGGIEALDLHGNLLCSIPKGLRRLDMLTSLNLSCNKLDNHAWDVISQVSSLRVLDLSKNELSKDIPESIGGLLNLENLDVSHNKLVLLPATLCELIQLRILNLSNNRFSDLMMDSLARLPNLTELNASYNALTGSLFPSTVDSLPSLQILDVSNNSIASLSFSESPDLPLLNHLDVSRNRLYALPDVGRWTQLLNLLAEDNSLVSLPSGFISLNQLRKADFKGNALRSLDYNIANMQDLEVLNLQMNPLGDRRLASLGWQSLRAELLRRLEEGELIASRDSSHEDKVPALTLVHENSNAMGERTTVFAVDPGDATPTQRGSFEEDDETF